MERGPVVMSKTGLEHVSKRLRELADELDAGPDDPPAVTPERLVAWGYSIEDDLDGIADDLARWVRAREDDEAGAA